MIASMNRKLPLPFQLLLEAWGDFRYAWKSLVGYMAWFAVLNLAVLAPLAAGVLEWIVQGSGHVAVTNEDLAGFALSLRGLGFLLTALSLSLAMFLIEVGGLTLIVAQAVVRGPVSLWRAVRLNAMRIPAFIRLSLIVAGVVLAIVVALACVLVTIKVLVLGAHDINYYLAERPTAWSKAVALAAVAVGVVGLVLLWLIVRWLFALPILLLKGTGARAALRESWRMTRGRQLRLGALVSVWWLASTLVWGALAWTGRLIVAPLYDWAGLHPGRVLPVVAVSAVCTFLTVALWNIITLGMHVSAFTRVAIRTCELPALAPPPDSSDVRPLQNAQPVLEVEEPLSGGRGSRRLTQWAWTAALSLVVISGLTGWVMLQNLKPAESVQVTAHRGSSGAAPENTMAAFRQAIADGADYIELDVQTCADGTVVVIHDRDLMRVAGDPRRVEDLTLDQLRGIDVGGHFAPEFAGQRVPTLAEVIHLVRGHAHLNIELKYNRPDQALIPAVGDLLQREQFLDQCVITSLNAGALEEFRGREPHPPTGLIVTASIGRISRVEEDFLSLSAQRVTARTLNEARRANKPVHVWTVNDPREMLQMIESGVDNIITDKPAVLRQILVARSELSVSEKIALRVRVTFGGRTAITSASDAVQ